MTTLRINLNEAFQDVAQGPALLQVIPTGSTVLVHIGDQNPGDSGRDNTHQVTDDLSYTGRQKMFVRADTGSATIIVTEVV